MMVMMAVLVVAKVMALGVDVVVTGVVKATTAAALASLTNTSPISSH